MAWQVRDFSSQAWQRLYWSSFAVRSLIAAPFVFMAIRLYILPLAIVFAANSLACLGLLLISRESGDVTNPMYGKNPLEALGCLLFILTPWVAAKWLMPSWWIAKFISLFRRIDRPRIDAFFYGTQDDLQWAFIGKPAALKSS